MMRLQNIKGRPPEIFKGVGRKGKEKKSHRFFAVATAKVGETRGERQGAR